MTMTSFLKLTFRARTLFLAALATNALWLTAACDSGFSDCATTYTCHASPRSGGAAGVAATGQGGTGGGAGTGGTPGSIGGTTTGGMQGSGATAGGAGLTGTGGVGGGGAAQACSTNHGGCDLLTSCVDNVGAAPTCGACPAGYIGTGATACTPTLVALTLSSGTLTPALSGDVTVYSVAVGLGAQTITLTPTAPAGATLTVNGQAVLSGASWTSPVLTLGANLITIVVSQSGHQVQSYTFTVNRGMSQQAYVKASNTGAGDSFYHVALSGDGATLAVGATGEASSAAGVNGNQADNSAPQSGAVYVFTRSGSTWSQQAYIKASNTGASDFFGFALALSADGTTLAVGATGEASSTKGINGSQVDNSSDAAGAVYVFTRSGITWTQQAYVKASNTETGDNFGGAVDLSADGNTLAVGAAGEDSNAKAINGNQNDNSATFSGAAYLFKRSGSTWSQEAYIKASNTESGDEFGAPLALSADGGTLAVAATFEGSNAIGIDGNQNDNSASESGAVYVFKRSSGVWNQQAYIKASNTEANDIFGYAIALSADGATLAVDAYIEDSAATGINGNQSDNSATASGAVYVFTRSGSAWSQQAYIKASNTGAGDRFGGALALSADGATLGVGAWKEPSNASGINGNQTDNSATDSGAAYLFVRAGGTWSQQAYVKASSSAAGDYFGEDLALSGDGGTLAVGADGEDSSATGINGNQTDNGMSLSGAVYVFR